MLLCIASSTAMSGRDDFHNAIDPEKNGLLEGGP